MQDLHKKALFWNYVWKENGSPHDSIFTSVRKNSRRKYHQGIKFVKSQKEKILADKMALDMMYNNTKEFWGAVKKANFYKTPVPNNIDNVYDDTSISNIFAKNIKLYIIVYLTKQVNSTC